uniref:Uncharacterized protein n=1 Tax=Rhizophora mucronata TaxID=61149 RepID=A0A2P2QWM4_RHIMU
MWRPFRSCHSTPTIVMKDPLSLLTCALNGLNDWEG